MATANGKSISPSVEHFHLQDCMAVGPPTFKIELLHWPAFVEKNMRRSASVSLPRLSFSDYGKLVARLAVAVY